MDGVSSSRAVRMEFLGGTGGNQLQTPSSIVMPRLQSTRRSVQEPPISRNEQWPTTTSTGMPRTMAIMKFTSLVANGCPMRPIESRSASTHHVVRQCEKRRKASLSPMAATTVPTSAIRHRTTHDSGGDRRDDRVVSHESFADYGVTVAVPDPARTHCQRTGK